MNKDLINEYLKLTYTHYESVYNLTGSVKKANKEFDKLVSVFDNIINQENYMDYFDYLLSLKLKYVDFHLYPNMFFKRKYRIKEIEKYAIAKSKSKSMNATSAKIFLQDNFGYDSKWGKGTYTFTKEELEKDDKICAERIKQGKFKPRTSWEFEPSRYLIK